MAKTDPLVGFVAPQIAVANFKQKHGKKIIFVLATTAVVATVLIVKANSLKEDVGL